jgi:hypothetical protein
MESKAPGMCTWNTWNRCSPDWRLPRCHCQLATAVMNSSGTCCSTPWNTAELIEEVRALKHAKQLFTC